MNEIEKVKGGDLESTRVKTPANMHPDYLYVSSRQVSLLTASLLLLAFFVFMAGYFFGQRKMLEHVHHADEKEAFADTIYANACSSCEPVSAQEQLVDASLASVVPQEEVATEDVAKKTYYAQLIGFGTYRAAHTFADRLNQKDLSVVLKERHSQTAQGKEIIWYQVVTESFAQRDDLVVFIEKIKKEATLHDIRIIAC